MRNALLLAPLFVATLAACSGDNPSTSGSAATSSSSSSSGSSSSGGAGGAGGQGAGGMGSGGGAEAESVKLLPTPCEKTPPAATRCESYEVTCGGADPATVDLAIYEPPAGTPVKGVIIFGSGGDGTGFYNFTQRKALTMAGYTIVDRRWPAGWFTGANDGPQQAACRYAAVVRYLRTTIAVNGLLCGTGNSGGSAELGYALTWQKAGESLNFAMPTSGPFHRLDLACQGDTDTKWPAECAALKASTCPECASTGCQLGNGPKSLLDVAFGGTPRCTAPAAGDLELLKARSPMDGPDAKTIGGARVHFLVGKDDPGAYEPLATALFDSLSASGVMAQMTYVTGAPHEMDTTPEGADAILNGLLGECVPQK